MQPETVGLPKHLELTNTSVNTRKVAVMDSATPAGAQPHELGIATRDAFIQIDGIFKSITANGSIFKTASTVWPHVAGRRSASVVQNEIQDDVKKYWM